MSSKAATNLGTRVAEHASANPFKRAMVCHGVTIDYQSLVNQAKLCAGQLQALGLPPGGDKRVGVLASPSVDYAIVTMASQFAGLTLVPLTGLVSSEALSKMIGDSGATIIFHSVEYSALLEETLARTERPIQLVVIGKRSENNSLLEAWWGDAALSFKPVKIQNDWVSDLIYSSGTTGQPKGIAQSYLARWQQCEGLGPLGMTPDTCLLQSVGLYSNFGMTSLFLTLWWGGTFFAMNKFSADEAVAILGRERIDSAWVPPATLMRIVDHPDFAKTLNDKPCLKLTAGAPLSVEQKRRVFAEWPGEFYDLYGQTETGTLSLLPIHAAPAYKFGSVGKPIPTAEVKIINEDGTELAPNTEGEITAYTPSMMSGYHQREDANAVVYWRDESGRDFVRTGDVGKLDEDGYLWLCDRKKDMIISGGYNVYPADIEGVISDHPAVLECSVVGFPSKRWGESPVAFIALRESKTETPDDVRSWVNERVGAVQRIAAVMIIPSLPQGAMGKILKRKLRDQYQDSFPEIA